MRTFVITMLMLAGVYFAAVWMGESLKLAVMTTRIKQAAERFFAVPDFHYYVLADGIATLLSRLSQWQHRSAEQPPPCDPQLSWSFADP